MKNIKVLFALFFVSLFLSACGGGRDAPPGLAPSVAFTKEVALTAGGTSSWGTAASERVMNLYLAADIKGSGIINAISVKHANTMPSPASCSSFTIKMGHTNAINLVSTFANNVEQGQGSFQTVRSGAVTIPAGAADTYFTIALAQPFHYNGVDNLAAEVTYSGCSGATAANIRTHAAPYDGLVYADPGTSTTGTVQQYVTDIKFIFAGGDNAVRFPSGGNQMPFTTSATWQKVQLLYRADEINGAGRITGIGFPVGWGDPVTLANTYTINVKLGHTSLSALTSTFANNFNTGTPVTIANALTFTVPAGIPRGRYVWIPFPGEPFSYNGTSNLIVEVEVTAASGMTYWASEGLAGSQSRVWAAAGAATGTVDDSLYGIKFRFAGSTMDVITPESTEEAAPFSAANDNKLQHLYRAAELGTKGTITKVAFRLSNADSNNMAYNSFAVVIGHATISELGSTFSANMAGAQTAFSGTYTVPAGLKIGDWIEVPLSTPFAYDGERNLVVQVSSLQGSAENRIKMSLDATRYKNRRAFTAGSNTTDTANVIENNLADLRLFLQ